MLLAKNNGEKKNSFPVNKHFDNSTNSIMLELLNQKQKEPKNIGKYSPETDKLTCMKNEKELKKYIKDNPHKGMPYGFPPLNKEEHKTLEKWLKSKSLVSDEKHFISEFEKKQIKKFENFFNNQDIKHQVTARYIYEHLFLAHLYFDKNSNNFFEIVRSKTKTGKIKVIPTRFPYEKNRRRFFL